MTEQQKLIAFGTIGRRTKPGDKTIISTAIRQRLGPETPFNTEFLPSNNLNCYLFPVNSKFYHGGADLFDNLIVMPLGKNTNNNMYSAGSIKPNILAVDSITDNISTLAAPIQPTWYGDPFIAKKYAADDLNAVQPLKDKCSTRIDIPEFNSPVSSCILAYKTTRPILFLEIQNQYNVAYLIQEILRLEDYEIEQIKSNIRNSGVEKVDIENITRESLVKNTLAFHNITVKDISKIKIKQSDNPADITDIRLVIDGKPFKYDRDSKRKHDVPFVAAMCKILGKNNLDIVGYSNDNVFSTKHKSGNDPHFHLEFCICNGLKAGLVRDYENIVDAQYNNLSIAPAIVKKYITNLKRYKVVNIFDYSGNLYEHAVWALLHSEYTLNPENSDLLKKQISVAAFLHNFRYMQRCVYNIDSLEYIRCDLYYNFNSNTLPSKHLVRALLEINNDDEILKTMYLINILLDILPLFMYSSITEQNKAYYLNQKIVELLPCYTNVDINNQAQNIQIIRNQILHIVNSIIITRNSTYPAINYMKNTTDQPNVNDRYNIVSTNIPYITNVSKEYPGPTWNIPLNIAEVARFSDITLFNTEKAPLIGGNDYISVINTVIERCILNQYSKDRQKIIWKIDLILDNVENTANPKVSIGRKENKINIYQTLDEDDNTELYLAHFSLIKLYEPYVDRMILRLNYQINTNSRIIKYDTEDYFTRIISVLETLKPIIQIIFEEYSSKNYPNLIANPPRFNHNSMNHLRQMWYTAVVLCNSPILMERYNDEDIFLLLLTSYCKSFGRVDETSKITPLTINTSELLDIFNYKEWQRVTYPVQETTPGFVVLNSLCIYHQILKIVVLKFNFQNANIYSKLHYLTVDALREIDQVNDWEWLAPMFLVNLGHYFDHCRPTTGFSQLDQLDVENTDKPKAEWMKTFLTRFFSNHPWEVIKEKFYGIIFDAIDNSGYAKQATKYEQDYNKVFPRRCKAKYLKYGNSITNRFIELSNDFHQAWDIICDYNKLQIK